MKSMENPQVKKEEFPKGTILDQYGNPYGIDNSAVATDTKEKFEPIPTIKTERKINEESPLDSSNLKDLKQKVNDLNEKYFSAIQKEDKALLYSELEEAQKAYRKMEEEMDTRPKLSEQDRKVAKLQALREIVRDLNERYMREMQREEKAILYSQLEQAQKEYRKLEEELDTISGNKKSESSTDNKLISDLESASVNIPVEQSASESVAIPIERVTTPEITPPNPDANLEFKTEELKKTAVESPAPIKNSEVTSEFTAEDLKKLEDSRDQYLKAKRLRGNIVRGTLGRLFGRNLDRKLLIGKEEMDFGGKEGKVELEKVRKEYQEILSKYRSTELNKLQHTLNERFTKGELTAEACDAEMKAKMIGLLGEEQIKIDGRAVEGIEKNIFEKMKTKWRQLGKTRLVAGALLGGAAALTAGTAAGAAVLGARTAMGSVGTYVGLEAALERYSKLIGHRGLVNKISKEGNFITEDALHAHISKIPKEDLKKEAARLRMLQVEKGISIMDNLPKKDNNRRIAAMIIQIDNELAVQETMNASNPSEKVGFADALSSKLALEINSRNEVVESEVDKERLKKMARKTIAVLAGGAVGWIIGGKLFNDPGTPPPTPPPPGVPMPPPVPPITITPDHLVTNGENTWKIIEANLNSHHTMAGLSPEAQTHMIDALKDQFDAMSSSALKTIGFSSGDANLLYVGDSLNMSGVLDDPSLVARALANAQHLSSAEITSIMQNNTKIAAWLANPTNRAFLTGAVNSSVIDEVLKGIR